MTNLTERMKEFWTNLKDSYPLGEQIQSADDLAAFFMEEGPRLEFGDELEDLELPEIAEAMDTYNTADPFEVNDLNDYEPNEVEEELEKV